MTQSPDDPSSAWVPPEQPTQDTPATDPSPSIQPLPPPPPPQQQPKTNGLAVAALITGLIGMVWFAIGFGIAALVQIRQRGERGRGLAIAGLALSAVWVTVVIAGVIIAVSLTPARDGSGRITKGGEAPIGMLKVGDCFAGFSDEATHRLVKALPCTDPHDGEVLDKLTLAAGSFPGDAEVAKQAETACDQRIAAKLARSRFANRLDLYYAGPDKDLWRSGDRGVTCIVRFVAGGLVSVPLESTVDHFLRAWTELGPGDCVEKWREDPGAFLKTIHCAQSHEQQVIATYTLPAGPWPGDTAAGKKAWAGCESRLDKFFAKHRPPVRVEQRYAYPSKEDWDKGTRLVLCLVKAEQGDLDRSLMPG